MCRGGVVMPKENSEAWKQPRTEGHPPTHTAHRDRETGQGCQTHTLLALGGSQEGMRPSVCRRLLCFWGHRLAHQRNL